MDVAKKKAAVGLDVAASVVESVHEVSIPIVPPDTAAVGHEVRQASPVKQRVVAESAVDEAYGIRDAAVCEEATKVDELATPAALIAKSCVPIEVSTSKRYAD